MRILFIVYDNGSLAHSIPHGTLYLAAFLREKGYDVSIYNQDVYHWPEAHLTQYIDEHKPDVVGLSIIGGYYQHAKLIKISKAIHAAKHKPVYILGGHGPAPEPEYFLRLTGAQYVCLGEGENTLYDMISGGGRSAYEVHGLAFIGPETNKLVVTRSREQIKDIDSLPFPAYDLVPMPHYMANRQFKQYGFSVGGRYGQMISGRGCPFHCTFCSRLFDGHRERSTESIVEEIKMLQKNYNIQTIEFHDELMMSSPRRVAEICEAFNRNNLNIEWACNGRLNVAHPEALLMMKLAGCTYINYGVEALDDDVLRNINKHLSVDQIITGVEATLRADIIPGLNIMWGNIGDTPKTLRKAVKFLKKYGDGTQLRTIRPVTPYPGSPLYTHCIKAGLLKNCEDFYKKHVNSDLVGVNLTNMDTDRMHSELKKANTELINHYYGIHHKAAVQECKHFYDERDVGFRGFRQM